MEHARVEILSATPRDGKRVVTFSYNQLEEHEGQKISSRMVVRVTERTIDRRRQRLLLPEIERVQPRFLVQFFHGLR